jgi:hypothetical protein
MRIRTAYVALVWLALLAIFPTPASAEIGDDCSSGAQFGRKLSGVVIAKGYIYCEPTSDPVYLRVRVRFDRWTGDGWTKLARGTATGRGDDGTRVDLTFREPCDRGAWRMTLSTWARSSQEDPWSPVHGPSVYRLRVRSCE